MNIQGMDIEMVKAYKYPGVHLNNKLDWTDNTNALYKKGQSRFRSYGVQAALLRTFFDSGISHLPWSGLLGHLNC